jgi:Na+-driven multidrug efflux pump
VKAGFKFCVKISFVFLLIVAILGFIFAPQLIALFRDDPAVIECGARALRFQCITFCLQSWVVMTNMTIQSMGMVVPATFLAVARQGLFFIPLVLILSSLFELTGIQMTQAIADFLTFCCAVPIQLKVLRSFPENPGKNNLVDNNLSNWYNLITRDYVLIGIRRYDYGKENHHHQP